MNQQVVAGIGNVYRAELLFRHRVNPYRPGRALGLGVWDEMWADLASLMRAGVRAGRIVTTLPQHRDRRTGRGADRGRVLRLPPHRPALPDVRHGHQLGRAADAKPLLVQSMSGHLS